MKALNLESIKLSQLRALVAVAEHHNFSEAALHLEVSQSAVSHAIASLEEELGVVLLSRGRHGANLTPVGEQVIGYARQILQILEMIGKEANLSKGLEGGQVRIASFRSIATHVLPAAIVRFRKSFPAIAISVTEYRDTAEIEQALKSGRADLGVAHLPFPSGFEAWEILRDEYLALLPPQSRHTDSPLTWPELLAYPLIMPPESDSCCALIYNHFRKAGFPITPAYQIQEDSTIVSMVSQGLGAAVLARLAAEPLPPEIELHHLPKPLERVIGVAIAADMLHTPPVFAFLETLKQLMPSHAL